MGFSDIGCYGGEIPTPNLDRLAAGGSASRSLQHGAVQPHAGVAADGPLSAPGGRWAADMVEPNSSGIHGKLPDGA